MLKTASRLAGATVFRRFTTGSTAAPAAEEMFKEAWSKVVPHIDPPKTPLSFIQPPPQLPSSIPPKLTLNLYLPHSTDLLNQQVDMVTVPATTGQMGILPGHTATMTELNPGILLLHQGNQTTKYFVSAGFAFVHPNSVADIITLEAVPINRIDPNMIEKGLAEFSQKLSSATTDYEKAKAQIGVDVHSALQSALTG
ncbi:ATP synthase subunit delta' mitochondrial [Bienertia sinuspersici]